jgi:predicted lipid carrier protein YhbT
MLGDTQSSDAKFQSVLAKLVFRPRLLDRSFAIQAGRWLTIMVDLYII